MDAGTTYYLDVCFKEYETQKNSIQTLVSGTSTSDIERILQKTDLNYFDTISDTAFDNALTNLEGQNYTFFSKKPIQKNVTKRHQHSFFPESVKSTPIFGQQKREQFLQLQMADQMFSTG